ncbi:MAG: aldo/keto reductase [Oscillospiraceae bacterium]|nr:aldo/keto reductase [Oscillospiraceae bacterium]
MQYRKDKYGNDISVLGFGCMRFQRTAGAIDLEETERQILAAIEGGVNYFDTAYIYPGSEAAIGTIFDRNNLREKIYIATKLPHYLIKTREKMERLFQEHLARLKTDYIDYYLMHMLTDVQTWERLKKLGILEFLEEKKRSGAIRQIGFSYHGNSDMFCKLLDAYDWDFCQIQYNYMDEHSQAGRRGLQYAYEKGIPVIIMEPLRGGKLVNRLPQAAVEEFEKHPLQYTPAQWAFRWLWNQKEVTCVLSGMNTMEMVQDNLQTASSARVGEMGAREETMLRNVVAAINAKMKVGCTGCGYCMPCPKGVDIPGTFAAYNRLAAEGWFAGVKEHFMCSAARKDSTAAYNCIGCGKCESHCPQQIQIRQELKNASKALEGPIYRIARKGVEILKLY